MDHGQSLGYLGTEQERDLACFWWASPTLATVLAHTAASFSCPTCCCVRPKTAEPWPHRAASTYSAQGPGGWLISFSSWPKGACLGMTYLEWWWMYKCIFSTTHTHSVSTTSCLIRSHWLKQVRWSCPRSNVKMCGRETDNSLQPHRL